MNLSIVMAVIIMSSFHLKPADDVISKEDCTCKGKRLYGKIKIVDSFPDLKV